MTGQEFELGRFEAVTFELGALTNNDQLRPNTSQCFALLRMHEIGLGVIASGQLKEARATLRGLDVARKDIVGSDTTRWHRNSPLHWSRERVEGTGGGIAHLLDRLGVESDKALHVGVGETGMKHAAQAGVQQYVDVAPYRPTVCLYTILFDTNGWRL